MYTRSMVCVESGRTMIGATTRLALCESRKEMVFQGFLMAYLT